MADSRASHCRGYLSLINLITGQHWASEAPDWVLQTLLVTVVSLARCETVATLTWGSDALRLNTAIRGLVCSRSKASIDVGACESKEEKVQPYYRRAPRGRGCESYAGVGAANRQRRRREGNIQWPQTRGFPCGRFFPDSN